jgi:23S rRNA (adenine2503-C2)-methyltransferase
MRANVNLIRYNEVAGLPFGRPKAEDVVKFQQILRDAGVNAHVRKSRGRDIDAACGQLRRKEQEREEQGRREQVAAAGQVTTPLPVLP